MKGGQGRGHRHIDAHPYHCMVSGLRATEARVRATSTPNHPLLHPDTRCGRGHAAGGMRQGVCGRGYAAGGMRQGVCGRGYAAGGYAAGGMRYSFLNVGLFLTADATLKPKGTLTLRTHPTPPSLRPPRPLSRGSSVPASASLAPLKTVQGIYPGARVKV